MKIYRGRRIECGVIVCLQEGDGPTRDLALRLDLRRHSPAGFEWGCPHLPAPSWQLALAILADAVGDRVAVDHCREFAEQIIQQMDGDAWLLTEDRVRNWVAQRRVDRPAPLANEAAEGFAASSRVHSAA